MTPEEEALTTAIEAFETCLHAETQSIVGADPDQLETFLAQKDETLACLIQAKEDYPGDPRQDPALNEGIDRILALQERNVQAFDKLMAKTDKDSKDTKEASAKLLKIRNAYQASAPGRVPRFEV